MIIKEIYIAGFGKLRDFKKAFNTGLNSITEENGFGKTTMTMFITSMLYGLPDTRSTKLEENPRKRYTPWDSGAFGGYIVFEEGGKAYRAERSFGKKASDDTFSLIDLNTGRACSDFSENLGEELFGIDADGFERTVFLSERNLSGKNTNPTVAAKLSNITYADGDIGGYDEAIKLLEAKRRAYQRRGGAGEIQDLENEIAELEDTVRELRGKRESSEEYTARIAELDAQIESIKRESEELHFSKKAMEHELKRREKENEYSSMMLDIAPDAFRESELLEFFDRKVPTDDEMESIHRAVRELSEKRDELKAVSVPPIANSVITKRAPDSVELMELRKRIGEINSLENTVINRQPRPESLFKTPPTLDEIRKLRTPQGGNSRTAFTVILIGIVLAATLALRLVMDSLIPVISGICGILLTIVGIYLAFSKKSKTNDAAIFEYAALCYVTPPKEDLSADEVLDKLEGDLDSYEYETRVYAAHYEKCDEAEKALPIKLRELDEFISRFTDKTGSKECAEALFYAALSYASEKNAAGENEAKAAAIRAEIEELEGRIAAFASRYPTEGTDAIAEIDRKLTEYKTLARMLAARRDTIKRFAEENPIVMEGPPPLLGFDAIMIPMPQI